MCFEGSRGCSLRRTIPYVHIYIYSDPLSHKSEVLSFSLRSLSLLLPLSFLLAPSRTCLRSPFLSRLLRSSPFRLSTLCFSAVLLLRLLLTLLSLCCYWIFVALRSGMRKFSSNYRINKGNSFRDSIQYVFRCYLHLMPWAWRALNLIYLTGLFGIANNLGTTCERSSGMGSLFLSRKRSRPKMSYSNEPMGNCNRVLLHATHALPPKYFGPRVTQFLAKCSRLTTTRFRAQLNGSFYYL